MDEHQCDRRPRLANAARHGAPDFIPIPNFLGTIRPLSEKEIHFGDARPGAPGLAAFARPGIPPLAHQSVSGPWSVWDRGTNPVLRIKTPRTTTP